MKLDLPSAELDLCDASSRFNDSFSSFLKLLTKYLCYLDSHIKEHQRSKVEEARQITCFPYTALFLWGTPLWESFRLIDEEGEYL